MAPARSTSKKKTSPQQPVAQEDMQQPQPQTLVQESGPVRVRHCRYGLMAYLTRDMYMGRSLELYGEFSPGEAALFAQVLKPGMTALDVGANIGAHTALFAQRVGAQGRVIAYEPQRVIYQLLCANAMMNGLTNIEARLAAVGAQAGSLLVPPLDYTQVGNFGSLSLGRFDKGEQVPVETIDSLNLPHCHFIKVDVEGMEADVIKGAAQTLSRHRPVLYVENDRREKSPALIQALFDAGYRLYWHMPPYYKPDNFYGNAENIFPGTISINMLAVPRESAMKIEGAREVTSPQDDWRTVSASGVV